VVECDAVHRGALRAATHWHHSPLPPASVQRGWCADLLWKGMPISFTPIPPVQGTIGFGSLSFFPLPCRDNSGSIIHRTSNYSIFSLIDFFRAPFADLNFAWNWLKNTVPAELLWEKNTILAEKTSRTSQTLRQANIAIKTLQNTSLD